MNRKLFSVIRTRRIIPWVLLAIVVLGWYADRYNLPTRYGFTFWNSSTAAPSTPASSTPAYVPLRIPEEILPLPSDYLSLSFNSSVANREQYASWRLSMQSKLLELLEMDNIAVLNYSYTILEETQFSDYTQFKIRYHGFDGAVLVAYVLSPLVETSNLLLVIPGHGIGAEGLISREVIDYQKSIGKVLAQNGYYVVVPELRSFGGLSASDKPILFANYAYALGKGVMHLWIMSCLTALKIAKDMMRHQTSHIGIVGCSLGGLLALMLGVLSDEVDLVVCASGLTSYVEVCAGKVDACELMYGMLKYFDYPDIAAAFAPRPMLVTYGAREEGCFEFEAHNLTSYSYVKKAYALMNAENQLILVIHPEGHTYDVESTLSFLSTNFP